MNQSLYRILLAAIRFQSLLLATCILELKSTLKTNRIFSGYIGYVILIFLLGESTVSADIHAMCICAHGVAPNGETNLLSSLYA